MNLSSDSSPSSAISDEQWFWIRVHDEISGPFCSSAMYSWYNHRSIRATLNFMEIAEGTPTGFRPLDSYIAGRRQARKLLFSRTFPANRHTDDVRRQVSELERITDFVSSITQETVQQSRAYPESTNSLSQLSIFSRTPGFGSFPRIERERSVSAHNLFPEPENPSLSPPFTENCFRCSSSNNLESGFANMNSFYGNRSQRPERMSFSRTPGFGTFPSRRHPLPSAPRDTSEHSNLSWIQPPPVQNPSSVAIVIGFQQDTEIVPSAPIELPPPYEEIGPQPLTPLSPPPTYEQSQFQTYIANSNTTS